MIRRLGNKKKIAKKILPFFPQHTIYVELFFGAGGMFFNKPLAKINFLNDLDTNIFKCFDVLINQKDALLEYLEMIPVCAEFWQYQRKIVPKNDIESVVKFLVLSNFGFMGKTETLKFEIGGANTKKQLLKNLQKTYLEIVNRNNYFLNYDFRKVLSKIGKPENASQMFIYADPPYLDTTNNYDCKGWTLQDSKDLINMCATCEYKMAISEYANPTIIELAKNENLNIYEITKRHNLNSKKRVTEILITNYLTENSLF